MSCSRAGVCARYRVKCSGDSGDSGTGPARKIGGGFVDRMAAEGARSRPRHHRQDARIADGSAPPNPALTILGHSARQRCGQGSPVVAPAILAGATAADRPPLPGNFWKREICWLLRK